MLGYVEYLGVFISILIDIDGKAIINRDIGVPCLIFKQTSCRIMTELDVP